MSKLPISKNTEAFIIAGFWNMGCESLPPGEYEALENIMHMICKARSINFESVGVEHKALSGIDSHYSDCQSNNAPAYLPSPCDCDCK